MSYPSPEQRVAGVLAPVFALRGSQDLGIGDTLALRELADWAASLGLRVLQILPINEPGLDNSPYNIISSMALDPSTIATFPDELPDLRKRDYKRVTREFDLDEMCAGPVRYGQVRKLKALLLEAAYETFCTEADEDRTRAFHDFIRRQANWLEAYALYRALVTLHDGSEVFTEWPTEQQSLAVARVWRNTLSGDEQENLERLVDFHRYVQWIAFSQWEAVRAHCEEIGISLMGDVPVGVSIHSCDVWTEPHVFDLTRSCGAPPEKTFKSDPFTEKWGQNWGFPLYDWYAMSRDNFAWWRRRLRAMSRMFDIIRVDHALGFFRIYSFPWRPEQNATFADLTEEEAKALTDGRLPGFVPRDDSTAENQERNRVHGEVLFKIMLEEIHSPSLIAEDLGTVPPYVRPTLESLEIPGFKIPQWEREPNDDLTPGADYPRLSLATYATHDHAPVHSFWNDWFHTACSDDAAAATQALEEMNAILAFCGESPLEKARPFDAEIHAITMRGLMNTNSWLAIPMITDILGTEDRFNVPGAIGDQNWTARLGLRISEIDRKFASPLKALRQILAQTGRNEK